MKENIKTILWFQIMGKAASVVGGGWTRADFSWKSVRRVGVLKAVGIAFAGNRRGEAQIATAWKELGGKPHILDGMPPSLRKRLGKTSLVHPLRKHVVCLPHTSELFTSLRLLRADGKRFKTYAADLGMLGGTWI